MCVYCDGRQVELTVNGIGERAGNTSLEELIMILKTRSSEFNVYCTADPTYITRASRMVSSFTGMVVQPNKAIGKCVVGCFNALMCVCVFSWSQCICS